jgi:hypothetical protein
MALQPNPENGGSFPQQGSVDWVQLGARTASFTIDILSRLSAANVDPYTLQVGQIIAKQFELSQIGRENVLNALNTLASYSSLGDLVWFGFGAKNIVRVMSSTAEGLICLALCGTISEYYHESVSPEIFSELVKASKAPPEFTPSVLQWKAMIKACTGTISRTSFGTLVEEMMQYNPHAWYRTSDATGATAATRRGFATPKSIAEALQGLASITRGDLKAITVIGGNDTGWFAAVSIWLFDLRLQIRSADGQSLYSNCDKDVAQVNIVFEGIQNLQQNGREAEEQQALLQLNYINRVYVLADATDLFKSRFRNTGAVASGRAPWKTLFRTVFGSDFERLMTYSSQTFATAIGCAARLLRGIVNAEEGVPKQLISCWQLYNSASYGKGFLQNLLECFPELEALKKGMESATKTSFLDAKVRYEQQISKLQISCECNSCKPDPLEINLELFCQPILVETVLALGLALSEAVIDEGLFPKRAGVEAMYQRQIRKRDPVTENGFHRGPLLEDLGPFAYVYRDLPHPVEVTAMENCMQLFTGYRTDELAYAALSEQGICIYRCVLGDVTDDLDISGKLHILPGIIEHHGKPYDRIADDMSPRSSVTESMVRSVFQYTEASVNVTETTEGLEMTFELTAKGAPKLEALKVNPAALVSDLTKASGWVYCRNSGCSRLAALSNSVNQSLDILGTEFQMVGGGRIARCAAVTLADRLGYRCILRNEECIQCCLRTGISGMHHYELMSCSGGEGNGESEEDRRVMVVSPSNKK